MRTRMSSDKRDIYGGPWSKMLTDHADAARHGGYKCPHCGKRFKSVATRNLHSTNCEERA